MYIDEIKETYAYLLSSLLELNVWASPLGWGTNPWPDKAEKYVGVFPPKKGHNWWKVSKHFKDTSKTKYLSFYKVILKAPVDETKYIGYSKKWVK